MTPPSKRTVVRHLKDHKGCSEREACEMVETPRSTVRYPNKPRDDGRLGKAIRAMSGRYKRYGYRRIWVQLKRKGWTVNLKRVYRIWKEEGLQLPRKRPKRRRHERSEELLKAERQDQVWSWDFVEDRTERGGRLKFLNLVDEYTRECLMIRVERSMGSREVLETLGWLFQERGIPEYIRSDNGPEFVSEWVREGLEKQGVQVHYITPGSPWGNSYIESFNGKFRDECLNREIFRNGNEAREVVELWRREYNEERPHSAWIIEPPASSRAR